MRGRHPKTDEMKRIQGTLKHLGGDPGASSLAPLSVMPEKPTDLGEDEGEFWDYVIMSLFNAERLRSVDIPNIRTAAFWWSVFCKARRDVNAGGIEYGTGTGYSRVTANLTAAEKASKMLKDFSDRYGLNLLYSDRIKPIDTPREDALDRLMRE